MKSSRRIRVMPPELARKIAAGEVVERPASAVKELLDNALDAGATRIAVDVRDGGLRLIRVTDDGHGIPREDLTLAFTSHATSKISDLEDLEQLETLGFRGEALFSIAAVGRIQLQTRTRGERSGSLLRVEFGQVLESVSRAAPVGTSITVEDLFSNVPARRRFARSLRAEGGRIQQVLLHYSLARPDVRFDLVIDGQSVLGTSGNGRILDAIAATYGPAVAADMVPIEGHDDEIDVRGAVSRTSMTRPTRAAIHVFVNGRPIQNRSLGFALEEAYRGYLMMGRHPLAAIHLDVPPEDVDPNIHPSKAEVRFLRDREVHRAVHHAVNEALMQIVRQDDRPPAFATDKTVSQARDEHLPLPIQEIPPALTTEPLMKMPVLRVFGQTNLAFIVTEGPDGLYMIDQHAAHERILFDQLEQQMATGEIASQPLLEAELIELDPGQIQALEENELLLQTAGFVLEAFGQNNCLVRSVPLISVRDSPLEVVREVLSELEALTEPAMAQDRALGALACKAAVKAGQKLDVQEMRELVVKLETTPRPSTCPHGRPTTIRMSHSQLEREFGRR